MTRRVLLCTLLLCAVTHPRGAVLADEEEVIFYPSYGFRDGSDWVIPMSAKVQNLHLALEGPRNALASRLAGSDDSRRSTFRERAADFLKNDQSLERVTLTFDKDPEQTVHRIANEKGVPVLSNVNGLVHGRIRLSDGKAQALLKEQGSTSGWLTFRAVSPEHRGVGAIRLIEPTGLSVISDIDDTIKISEVPAGKRILATNTFLRDFVAAPELVARYKALADASFHYVSGSPWQLYRPVATFLIEGGHFPAGTFHMKTLRGNLLTGVTSLEDLANFVTPEGTHRHKVAEITALMKRFPKRTFILVGDSGEGDPEIYAEIRATFGSRVQEIVIRDVVNARQGARLKGMTVVEAPTIRKGVSQLVSQ
jgi:phosphatidate phosphatase APP1